MDVLRSHHFCTDSREGFQGAWLGWGRRGHHPVGMRLSRGNSQRLDLTVVSKEMVPQ